MRESDEFYARPNETYEQYVHRKARKTRSFLSLLKAGRTQSEVDSAEHELKGENG